MNIAVVGGSGFIGSHIVDKLLEHGHEVTVFDIMRPHRDDVRHIFIDVSQLSKTAIALSGYYEAVYMLAAVADVNDVYRNPVESAEVNVLAVANVLESARRANIDRVILASTTWVYEMAVEEKVDEQTLLLVEKANHIYTATKLAAELYCHGYQKLYGLDFTILRYGIPYGPRARGGTVMALFIKKALRGESLTINGDGSQYRSYIYVEDLAEGNVAALQEAARNQTYNLDGLRPITVNEVAQTVRKVVGEVSIEHKEARPGDYGGNIVSSAKAQRDLGWQPKVDFEEGIRRYFEWYSSHVYKK